MKPKRLPPVDGSPEYRQLWRVVDGSVLSCFKSHPEYLANPKRVRTVRNSIVKRVVGAVIGYVEEVANSSAQARSEFSPAREMASRTLIRFASGSPANEPWGGIVEKDAAPNLSGDAP